MAAIGKKEKRISPAEATLGFMSVLTLVLVLLFPSLAIDYMNRGMKLCVGTVIPSLFPFMVASELIVITGAASGVGKIFRAPARLLFGISPAGASALALGMVCGFPVGTRSAVSMYKRGEISGAELSRLVAFSNNPSSAFLISAVGTTLFGSREFGSVLYFITILSSLTVGVLQNIILGRAEIQPVVEFSEREHKKERKGISEFSAAVSSSALAMLGICAFVVFFSTVTGTLGVILSSFGASQIARAIFFSFFELTSGVAEAAGVEPLTTAILVAAFAVGWSGLSVHLQMIGICNGTPISLRRYFLAKLSQGLMNAALVFGYLKLFGDTLTFDVKSVGAFLRLDYSFGGFGSLVLAAFVLSLSFAVFVKLRKKIK